MNFREISSEALIFFLFFNHRFIIDQFKKYAHYCNSAAISLNNIINEKLIKSVFLLFLVMHVCAGKKKILFEFLIFED